jgi:hypothetical protein
MIIRHATLAECVKANDMEIDPDVIHVFNGRPCYTNNAGNVVVDYSMFFLKV